MHVVHLEDDGPLREIMKVALVAAVPTINLQQFISSDETIKYIHQNLDDISMYILDIRVPGSTDGIGVAKKIRELNAPGIVVVTSAYGAPERKLLNELDCMWFAKPWHIMEVLDKLLPLLRN